MHGFGEAMKYLSLFSGIEAASVAWHPLGWQPVAFAEIEPFPSAVLQHRFPSVPNWGDVSKFKEWPDASIDLVVGGSPCQAFSVAGLRKGLDDPRGNLSLTYLAIVEKYLPEWIVWENVPGVLSSSGGRDFAAFLGALDALGYGYAWRVLDAQYVRTPDYPRAVPQRRRRVFVVGNRRGWQRAAAVLFDGESLSGNPAPSREKRQGVARTVGVGASTSSNVGSTLRSNPGSGWRSNRTPVESVVIESERVFAYETNPTDARVSEIKDGVGPTVKARWGTGGNNQALVQNPMAVRRLTPVECERLQGFPDGWTQIPWRKKPAENCPDGPRYKAIGNSMAVNVMQWIGLRIAMIEELKDELSGE